MSSSSQRRPRAIAATSVARRSSFIGRSGSFAEVGRRMERARLDGGLIQGMTMVEWSSSAGLPGSCFSCTTRRFCWTSIRSIDQQGRVGVVDRARAFVSRLQDNLANLIVDVRGRDPRDRTNVGCSCIPEQKRPRDIVAVVPAFFWAWVGAMRWPASSNIRPVRRWLTEVRVLV